MSVFDLHLRRAKKSREEDLLWMIACYYEEMRKLCRRYGFPGDKDMLSYLIDCFWEDMDEFVIYDNDIAEIEVDGE